MIALALLANDRFQSIQDPVKYLANADTSPLRRALRYTILPVLANGLEILVQCDFIQNNKHGAALLYPLSHAIRTVYLFVATYL